MNRRRTLCLLIAVAAVGSLSVLAGESGPSTVSPGAADRITGVEVRCPMFSWQAVPGAVGYEVVVYELSPQVDLSAWNLDDAVEVLFVVLPAGVAAWAPPLENGLARGADFVWFVRGVFEEAGFDESKATGWSAARFFRVVGVGVEDGSEATPGLDGRESSGTGTGTGTGTEGQRLLDVGTGPGRSAMAKRVGDVGTKDVGTALAAIRGEVPDPTGETYGVVGTSNSVLGAGVAAVNTAGGPDLVLEGVGAGQPDTALFQWGLDRSSPDPQTFYFGNLGGGGMTLNVDGAEVVTTLTDQDTLGGLSCATWQVAKWDGGNWVCRWDSDTLYSLTCAGGEIAKWNGAEWVCAPDDDTLATLSCLDDQVAKWNGSAWACDDDLGTVFSSTFIVSPVGDWIQNGAALLAAIATLPPGRSVVYVEPGYYDLDGASLVLPANVQLTGVPGKVRILSDVCDYPVSEDPAAATVILGSDTGLRDLEVTNDCADPGASAIAVLNPGGFTLPTLDNVSMRAWSNANTCIGLYSVGDITIDRGVGFSNCSSGTDYGIIIEADASIGGVTLTNCDGIATYGGQGIYIGDAGAQLRNVYAAAVATGTGLVIAADGVWVEGTRAEGGSGGTSISVTGGDGVTIVDTVVVHPISVDGVATSVLFNGCTPDPRYPYPQDLNVTGDAYVEVMNSQLGTVNVGPGTVRIGASKVSSVVTGTGGSAKCAGVWDSGFTFFASTCP